MGELLRDERQRLLDHLRGEQAYLIHLRSELSAQRQEIIRRREHIQRLREDFECLCIARLRIVDTINRLRDERPRYTSSRPLSEMPRPNDQDGSFTRRPESDLQF